MTSIRIKEEFEKIEERYFRQVAKDEAEKYNNGTLSIKTFIKNALKITGVDRKKYIEQFLENIDNSIRGPIKAVIESALAFSYNNEIFEKLINVSIYKLKSQELHYGECILSTVVYGKDNIFDRYGQLDKVMDDKYFEQEIKYVTEEIENEAEIAINNFIKLKEELLSRNPNVKIRISNREIIVEDGGKISFYKVIEGQIVPMEITEKIDLKFQLEENKEQVALPPVKVGKFASFINGIKRKLNNLENRNKEPIPPNYSEGTVGKIVFSPQKEDRMSIYRVPASKLRHEYKKEESYEPKIVRENEDERVD